MTDASPDNILRVIQIFVLLGSVVINCYLFWRSRSDEQFKAIDKRLRDMDHTANIDRSARVDEHARLHNRVTTLEEWRKHVPTNDDIKEIHEHLSQIGRTVAAVDERSDTTMEGVKRIEQFLIERGSR